jgi:hypothetical protein
MRTILFLFISVNTACIHEAFDPIDKQMTNVFALLIEGDVASIVLLHRLVQVDIDTISHSHMQSLSICRSSSDHRSFD